MAVLMTKFDLSDGAAVVDNAGDYGFVHRSPYTHPKYGTVADVDFITDDEFGGIWQVYPQHLERKSSCECGNPFTLCHPEA